MIKRHSCTHVRRILVWGTGTQGYAIIESLHKKGYYIGLLYNERNNYADNSRYLDKKHYLNPNIKGTELLNVLIEILKKEKYEALIPMGDHTAAFMSSNKEILSEYVSFKMPDYSCFLNGYDKNSLMKLCSLKGYPHPDTTDLTGMDMNEKKLHNFNYPAILKPNITTGGRGMKIINCWEELVKIYPVVKSKYGNCHLQRFIKQGGRQVKVQLYIDENKKLICHSVMDKVRWYPVKGGSSCCAVTIKDDNIVDICYNILKDLNWEGFADFDTIEDPDTGQLLIMEINPRVPACIKAAISSGVDWGELIVDCYLNLPCKNYTCKIGTCLRHLGLDTLWFLKSHDKFKTQPSWFHLFGKNVFYQDLNISDPIPFVVGSFQNVLKLFNPDFRKSKQK